MKKTLKSLLAVTLSFILAFGGFSAFAADENENKIEWDFGWWVDEYTRSGEAVIGENTVNYNEDTSLLYYDFTAENAGYYSVTFKYSEIDWACFPQSFANAYATGENIVLSLDDEETETVTFVSKLEAGTTVLGVDYYNSEIASAKVVIEYLGENISDIVFDEEALGDFIYNYDIVCRGADGILVTDFEIAFPNGDSFAYKDTQIGFTCEKFEDGENKVIIKLEDFEKEITVISHPIEYYVSDAVLSNADNYTTISYDYLGSSDMYYISGESVKITFVDGTTYTSGIDYSEGSVVFPNGKDYPVVVNYTYNDEGSVVLAVYVAGTKINEYECTETNAGFIDNLGSLKNENNWETNNFFNDLVWGFNSILYSGSIAAAFEAAREFFFDFFISLSNLSDGLFSNIMYFLRYYLA